MEDTDTTKRCRKCGRTKSVSEFGLDRKRQDQLTVYCVPCKNEDSRQVRLRRRAKVVAALGGKCVECGYDKDIRALQLDHVNGGGGLERRSGLSNILVERAILRGERLNEIQLLCANCNLIKSFDSGERIGTREYVRHIQTTRTVRPHGRSTAASRARTAEISKASWDDPDRAARMSITGPDGGYRPDILEARRPQIEAKRAAALKRQTDLSALVAERRETDRSAVQLPSGSWSRFFESCLGCRTTDRRHASDGCCTRCNGIIKGYGLRPDTKVLAPLTVSSAPPPPS